MGGSRTYSVSSNGSMCSSGSSTSGNYSDYSRAGREKLSKTTAVGTTKLVYSQQRGIGGGGAGSVMTPQQQQNQRALQRRIMCRCCLSEQQLPTRRQSLDSCPEQELNDEEASLFEFVPLDSLAMVDLSDDKYISSTSAGNGSDSYKSSASARTAATRGGRMNRIQTTTTMVNKSGNSTLLDCLNACARIGASFADIELPQHICLDCCHTLEMCCEFIRCVRNADKILRRRCALPSKRSRQQQLQHQTLQQHQQATVGSGVYGEEEGPAAKRRRRREEKKVHQEYHWSVARAGSNAKGLGCNTPKSISLPKAVTATAAAAATANRTSAERDQLLDISIALNGVESSLVRSFDSGIEIDEDLCSVKSSDASSANENPLRYHLAKYEGYSYVVAETLSHDLERFHRCDRKQAATGGGIGGVGGVGGGASAAGISTTYKCGFCIFETNIRQELNKHLQIHLGPPQHSCRKCNFVGHFKFLLAHHMRNVHHCALEAIGTGQEVYQKNADRSGGDITRVYKEAAGAATESPKYYCHLCEECFVNYDALQQHRKSHKVFCKCTICTFKSSTRENVLEHLAKEHKVLVERRLIVKYIPLQRINAEQMQELTPTKNNDDSTDFKLLTRDNKYRKHLCQFCGKCFDRRFHLLKHEYGVHRIEIEQTNSADALTRTKLSAYGAAGNSTKYTKLKYLRQRNAVQAARQQRCVEDLALLDDQQPDRDITSKFRCVICSAVFMYNFELKYHMRTHKISTPTQTAVGGGAKELAVTRTPTLSETESLATVAVKSEQKLTAVIAKECAEQQIIGRRASEIGNAIGGDNDACNYNCDRDVYADVKGDSNCNPDADDDYAVAEGEDEAVDDSLKSTDNEFSNAMNSVLTSMTGDVDLDLMSLVAPQASPLDSLDASPTSSNNSFDINYDDQLYLNDFDLGLLDCSGGFEGL